MSNLRIITFYLPQYHPIPENDEWWGKGFTDWINVAKSKSRFTGHHQPHIPKDLGFYDLRLEETRIAQAELAKSFGISAFCYYHYWFNEKMLLERPFNEVLNSGKPDFPFCLCWANENWTRRWDGLEKEILIAQCYEKYDSKIHIDWLDKAFSDKRYIRVNNKPLFLIYNIDNFPNLKNRIIEWRKYAKQKGYIDLYLCAVKGFHNNLSYSDIMSMGFDAIVNFVPNSETFKITKNLNSIPKYFFSKLLNKLIVLLNLENKINLFSITNIVDYKKVVNKIIKEPVNKYKFFPCVMPSWDNCARKRSALVIQNDDAELYRNWLENSFAKVEQYSSDEQIVFINAWNEWAEGCHLEPDFRNGKKFLDATLKAINSWQNKFKSQI